MRHAVNPSADPALRGGMWENLLAGSRPGPKMGGLSRAAGPLNTIKAGVDLKRKLETFPRLICGVFMPAWSPNPLILGSTQNTPDYTETLVKIIRCIR